MGPPQLDLPWRRAKRLRMPSRTANPAGAGGSCCSSRRWGSLHLAVWPRKVDLVPSSSFHTCCGVPMAMRKRFAEKFSLNSGVGSAEMITQPRSPENGLLSRWRAFGNDQPRRNSFGHVRKRHASSPSGIVDDETAFGFSVTRLVVTAVFTAADQYVAVCTFSADSANAKIPFTLLALVPCKRSPNSCVYICSWMTKQLVSAF